MLGMGSDGHMLQKLNASAQHTLTCHVVALSCQNQHVYKALCTHNVGSCCGPSPFLRPLALPPTLPACLPTPQYLLNNTGDDQPQLPGGCRMGALTDTGFNMALNLGSQLRQRYLLNHKLLPAHELDLELLHAESTAFQRTVTTLRGVLTGLYPNSSAVVPVAVRQPKQEVMLREAGCPRLANLTRQLWQVQAAQGGCDVVCQKSEGTKSEGAVRE